MEIVRISTIAPRNWFSGKILRCHSSSVGEPRVRFPDYALVASSRSFCGVVQILFTLEFIQPRHNGSTTFAGKRYGQSRKAMQYNLGDSRMQCTTHLLVGMCWFGYRRAAMKVLLFARYWDIICSALH
jgi:hypothetical protein